MYPSRLRRPSTSEFVPVFNSLSDDIFFEIAGRSMNSDSRSRSELGAANTDFESLSSGSASMLYVSLPRNPSLQPYVKMIFHDFERIQPNCVRIRASCLSSPVVAECQSTVSLPRYLGQKYPAQILLTEPDRAVVRVLPLKVS